MSECKCSMSISVLGDGCRYCQPQEYIDSLEILHKENDELLETCEDLERQLAEVREIVAGMDIYIEAECHESWANNYEIRESAFVDMAKKLKQLKEKGE